MLSWLDYENDTISIDELRQMVVANIASQVRTPTDELRIRNLSISLTLLCNQGCQHCWVNARKALEDELSTDEICSILRQARDLGAEQVKLTGGEPFTRKDFLSILLFALNLGYRVSVETNGLLLRDDYLDQLDPFKQRLHFYISLDGATARTHDAFRNSPGAYDKTVRTLHRLAQRQFYFSIHTVANKTNLHEILPLYKMISSIGALQHKVILSIHRLGRGANAQDKSLDVEDIISFTSSLEEINFWDYRWQLEQNSTGTRLMTTLPPAFHPLDRINASSCGWSVDFCGILANGKVAMCHGAYETEQVVAGSIRDDSLEHIWKHSQFFTTSRGYDFSALKGICGNCAVAPACRGLCRATTVAEYGELLAPYPLCQIMYERGLFPKYMMVDPDRDCAYTPPIEHRHSAKCEPQMIDRVVPLKVITRAPKS